VRYLASALLTEGESDQAFLLPVVQRQLEIIGLESGFDVGTVRTSSVRTVDHGRAVAREGEELLDECHLLLVHHDKRERAKIERLRSRLLKAGVVGIVPVRETEAWVMAAMYTLSVPGLDARYRPDPLQAVEKDPDPKATLNRAYTRGDPAGVFARVGEQVDLDILAQLPAYQALQNDLNAALKELHFL
jgi:hypothetical protein